jgi:hypothetical protein
MVQCSAEIQSRYQKIQALGDFQRFITKNQWWASYLTSVTCKSNSLLLIRYPFFIVTVPLQLLVTDILNVTK